MICTKYSSKLSEKSVFCNKCGNKVANERLEETNSIIKTKTKCFGKIIISGIIISVCILIGIVIYCNMPGQKAKQVANNFMKYMAEQSIKASTLTARSFDFSLVDYTSIDIFSYKLISSERISDKQEEIHTKKYKSQSQDLFFREKDLVKSIYLEDERYKDEYELVLETGDLLIIRSNKYKVKQYMCNYDIIYSDLLGNEKRKIVTIILIEDKHDSNNFKVADLAGLVDLGNILK